MKRVSIFCLSLFCVVALSAQKIVERSASKRPDWVGQVREGCLIISATAGTLDGAQRKCLDGVKVQMLQSVAQNIEYSAETMIEQLTHNDDVKSDITFRQKGKTSVVNLPYISGVSLANAKGVYWEAIRDGHSGALSYTYSLLYPYPHSEYMKLKAEFERMDTAMVALVNREDGRLAKAWSVDSLEASIANLDMAEDYFFDSQRKKKACAVREKYINVFKQLNVESKRIEKCKFRCWITWNGEVMECSVLPKCKSETATKIKAVKDDESYVITFSDEECIDDEDNQIDVVFRLKYNTLKHKLHF